MAKWSWPEKSTTVKKHSVREGRRVIAVINRYANEDGKEEEITILRGFYANDNYDPRDFGLDSNTFASAAVASTISHSSVKDKGCLHS